jgi:5-methylcytosine-specific restriction endonuclease McrA
MAQTHEEELARKRENRAAHREEINVYKRNYRAEHLEKIRTQEHQRFLARQEECRALDRRYRETHREEIRVRERERYLAHKEEQKLSTRKYKETHQEQLKEQNRKYRATHRGKINERFKKYKLAHPEIFAIHHARRRARKLGCDGSHTAEEWKKLKAASGNKCLACGRTDVKLTQDHIIPLVLGGSDNISNIQPLCQSCNCKKHTKVIDYHPGLLTKQNISTSMNGIDPHL